MWYMVIQKKNMKTLNIWIKKYKYIDRTANPVSDGFPGPGTRNQPEKWVERNLSQDFLHIFVSIFMIVWNSVVPSKKIIKYCKNIEENNPYPSFPANPLLLQNSNYNPPP